MPLFVGSLDIKKIIVHSITIDIAVDFHNRNALFLQRFLGKVKQVSRIGLEMDKTAVYEDLMVQINESGRCQTFFCLSSARVRVGKSDPDLRNFAVREDFAEPLYRKPKKSDIGDPILQRLLRATPESSAFEIDANEVAIRVA